MLQPPALHAGPRRPHRTPPCRVKNNRKSGTLAHDARRALRPRMTPPATLGWDAFLRLHVARRAAATAATAPLLDGDFAPAAALLAPWRFAADPTLLHPLLHALRAAPPTPDPRPLAAFLVDAADLPAPPPAQRTVAEWIHRVGLTERMRVQVAPTREARIAWGLHELAVLGGEVERYERAAWASHAWAVDPPRDARIARFWSAWLGGDPWGVEPVVDTVLVPVVQRAFRAAMERHGVPPSLRAGIVAEVARQLMLVLLRPTDGGLPGMLDIASRVLETAPPDPLAAVGGQVDRAGWGAAARCVARRGEWAGTVRSLYPNRPDAGGRAQALGRRFEADGAWIDVFADLHVARRVLATWSVPAGTLPDATWAVVTQNRGRVRARLRAIVARAAPGPLLGALLPLAGLHARTLSAVRRFAWDWARQELSLGYALGGAKGVTADCAVSEPTVEPLTPPEADTVRTWVLKCVLRGRGAHLCTWVRSRGTGDGDTKWGRLLAELPEALRRLAPDDGGARYVRLRAHLADDLYAHLDAVRPLVAEVTAIPPGRGAPARLATLLDGRWDPAIPAIKSGFPTLQETMADNLAWIDAVLAHPEDP